MLTRTADNFMLLILTAIVLLGEAGIVTKPYRNARQTSGLRNEVEINNETFYIAMDGLYLTWHEAEAKCLDLGMQLVTLDSEQRWTMIAVWLRQNPEYDLWMWSSGHRTAGQDHFVWTTNGDNFTYSDWNLGQPDMQPDTEACVNFYASFGGWDDDPCSPDFTLTYMCEYPPQI